jgi:2-octaprenyl-6-methoxyphenol hydroxylase
MLPRLLFLPKDGGQSTVRKLLEIDQAVTEYQQAAIVTTIKTEIGHDNVGKNVWVQLS